MRKQLEDAKVLSNEELTTDVYKLTVSAPGAVRGAAPGMFYQLRLYSGQELLLRRPLSIADIADDKITFIYRIVGRGTAEMTTLREGDRVNCLGPLGKGFLLDAEKPLLVGGGMGTAPLLYLAKVYAGKADFLIGGRNKRELFWVDLCKNRAKNIFITTDDGSWGKKGFTVDLLPNLLGDENYDMIITCGPEVMMRGIYKVAKDFHVKCQVSLERRMACGLGACLSCSIDTTNGRKKVCKDGPVFLAQEVL